MNPGTTTRRRFVGATSAALALPNLVFGAAKPPLRYLQIGTTHPHANKISAYRESPDWNVVGLVEPDRGRRLRLAFDKTYSGIPLYSLEDGLALPKLDCVGIETEIAQLLEHAEKALAAGCHLHLDKPAGSDLARYRRLLEQADKAGKVMQMGYMYRFNPAVQFLRHGLKAGWFGEVFETHAVMSKVMSDAARREVAQFKGGTMFELGCHIIDLTVGVLGAPQAIRAFSKKVIEGDDLMDNMLAVFDYPKATATIRSSGVEVEGFARRQFTVCGTEGTCHIQPLDRPGIKLSLSKEQRGPDGRKHPKGQSTIAFDPPYRRYVGDVADLAKTIRGEQANPFPSAHDLAVQIAVLKAAGM